MFIVDYALNLHCLANRENNDQHKMEMDRAKLESMRDPDYDYEEDFSRDAYDDNDYDDEYYGEEPAIKFRLQVPTSPNKAPLDQIIPKPNKGRPNMAGAFQRIQQQQMPIKSVYAQVPNTGNLRDVLRKTVVLRKGDTRRRPALNIRTRYGAFQKAATAASKNAQRPSNNNPALRKKQQPTLNVRDRVAGTMVKTMVSDVCSITFFIPLSA
jgi:hypothetical protein